MIFNDKKLVRRIDELSSELKALRTELLQKNRHLHGETWDYIKNARPRVDFATKTLLMQMYRERAAKGDILDFQKVAYSNYSQFCEDGVLEYIFELIGTTNKVVVEMCCGPGSECNATNLILNNGWAGLLIDGSETNIAKAKTFFNRSLAGFRHPKLVNAWITRGNINSLISDNMIAGEIDLFSLDVDGNDYWFLEALTVIQPRVIILEAQMLLGPDLDCSVPYDDDFVVGEHEYNGQIKHMYSGASVRAFSRLCVQKGYRLVGKVGDSSPNIIFIKNGVGEEYFPAIEVADIFADLGAHYLDHFRGVREVSFANFDWLDLAADKTG
ncbi:MAG: hypothetical protein AAF850_11545 [Pseudomonadota bacterium]